MPRATTSPSRATGSIATTPDRDARRGHDVLGHAPSRRPATTTRCARSTRPATSPIRATGRPRPCRTPRSRLRPATCSATAVGPNQVNLTWHASGDNIGVTGYRVFRDATQIATLGAVTTYSDTGAAGSTTYAYTVRALDAAGNVSDPSNSAPATTPAASATFTFSPEADARTQASAATTNYATSNLRIDGGSNPAVESLLRFTVTGAPAGSIRSAKLRVYAYSGTVDGPAVFTTNPAWTETAVNWNNRPPRTSATTDDKGAIATNSWVEYDVTPFVTATGRTASASPAPRPTASTSTPVRPRHAAARAGRDDGPHRTRRSRRRHRALAATVMSATRVDLTWQAVQRQRRRDRLQGLPQRHPDREPRARRRRTPTRPWRPTRPTATRCARWTPPATSPIPSNTAPATTPPAAPVLTLAPEADARVQEANPTTNYGTAYLRANGGTELGRRELPALHGHRGAGRQACRAPSCASTTTTAPRTGPPSTRPSTSWSETDGQLEHATRPARAPRPTTRGRSL